MTASHSNAEMADAKIADAKMADTPPQKGAVPQADLHHDAVPCGAVIVALSRQAGSSASLVSRV